MFKREYVVIGANDFSYWVFIRGFYVVKTQFGCKFMDSVNVIDFFSLEYFISGL